jgi:hypothetical protein
LFIELIVRAACRYVESRRVAAAKFGVPIGGGSTLLCGARVDAAKDVTRADCVARVAAHRRGPRDGVAPAGAAALA